MTGEIIIIDGVDISGCDNLYEKDDINYQLMSFRITSSFIGVGL